MLVRVIFPFENILGLNGMSMSVSGRPGWTAEKRKQCDGLILTARKTELGGVRKYLTKQDQSKNFNTSFYWDEEEIEELGLMEKLDRLLK